MSEETLKVIVPILTAIIGAIGAVAIFPYQRRKMTSETMGNRAATDKTIAEASIAKVTAAGDRFDTMTAIIVKYEELLNKQLAGSQELAEMRTQISILQAEAVAMEAQLNLLKISQVSSTEQLGAERIIRRGLEDELSKERESKARGILENEKLRAELHTARQTIDTLQKSQIPAV